MRVHKAFKYRLYPTPEQETLFVRTAGCRRALWNAALEQRSMWRPGRKRIGYHDQAGELRELKAELPWFKEVPHHCLQQTLVDLDQAFQRFFAGLAGYPRRKRKWSDDSFRFPDPTQVRIDAAAVKLPKAGLVKAAIHRPVEGRIRSLTVSRTAGRWFAAVQCEVDIPDPAPIAGPEEGVDLGVVKAMALSSGRVIDLAQPTERDWRRIARLQKEAARKLRGSKNRAKALRRVAKLRARMARRLEDGIHKATTHLAKTRSLIAIEDLEVGNMTASARGSREEPGRNVRAKAGLNRSILGVAPGKVRRQLACKTRWYGSTLVVVPAQGTSLACHACDHVARENRKSQAIFSCVACGHEADADVNAARNILARAKAGRIAAPKRAAKTLRKPVAPRSRTSDRTPLERGRQPAEPSVPDMATKQEFRDSRAAMAE